MTTLFELATQLFGMALFFMPMNTFQTACANSPDTPVPSFVVGAAAGTPSDFASALAEARACAGFIMRQETARRVTRAWRHDAQEPTRTLKDAFSVFQQAHPGFQIQLTDGLWLIRENGVDTLSGSLSAIIPVFEVKNTPVVEALRQALGRVVPGMPTRGGVVGSTLGRPADPTPSPEDMLGPNVTIRLENGTLVDVLVAIGRASPGVVWVLTQSGGGSEGTAPSYRLTCFLPQGLQQQLEGVIR